MTCHQAWLLIFQSIESHSTPDSDSDLPLLTKIFYFLLFNFRVLMMRRWNGIQGDVVVWGTVGAWITPYQLVPRKLVSQAAHWSDWSLSWLTLEALGRGQHPWGPPSPSPRGGKARGRWPRLAPAEREEKTWTFQGWDISRKTKYFWNISFAGLQAANHLYFERVGSIISWNVFHW